MKASELFGVVIRSLGIWEIVLGISNLPMIVAMHGGPAEAAVMDAGTRMIVGAVLYFAAGAFVGVAYGSK